MQIPGGAAAASGERARTGLRGRRADSQEQGVPLRARQDDLGPQLLRVQSEVPGPQGQGSCDVSPRLALQGKKEI